MKPAAQTDATSHDSWETNVWAIIPSFLGSSELVTLRDEADRLWSDQGLFGVRGAVPNSATRSDRLDPVIDVSPLFRAVANDARLTAAVEAALGGEARLLKDKFIAKPPGAGGYAAHQDGAYWPGMGLQVERFLTAIIFLDDSTAEKGAIECAPGFHRALLTDPAAVADPDETALGEFAIIEAMAGDLLLLHSLTPHRSAPNRSTGMRRALLFTYGVDPRPDLYDLYRRSRQALY
jgi:2-aminoethylphosphonate dioxygenase